MGVRFVRVIVLLLAGLSGACVSLSYSLEGKKYQGRESFLTAVDARCKALRLAFEQYRLETPISQLTLTIAITPSKALEEQYAAIFPWLVRGGAPVAAEADAAIWRAIADGLRATNVYAATTLKETAEPLAPTAETTVIFRVRAVNKLGWQPYLHRQGGERVPIDLDNGTDDMVQRVKPIVSALKAAAAGP
jgi:hypothetical protein